MGGLWHAWVRRDIAPFPSRFPCGWTLGLKDDWVGMFGGVSLDLGGRLLAPASLDES